MREADPTDAETEFVQQLRLRVPELQDWYHADRDGTPWMTVSYDDFADSPTAATWRLDFDGRELVGGRSPGFLNWDDGVRGRETGMSVEPPEGVIAQVSSAAEAVDRAADWFRDVTRGRAVQQ